MVFKYIQLVLIIIAILALVAFFVGVGIFAILAFLIMLPIARFFLFRKKKFAQDGPDSDDEGRPSKGKIVDVEYQIIERKSKKK